MLVIKIGGCNGSGKTSVVRALMHLLGFEPVVPKGKKRPEAYVSEYAGFPVYILGSYENVCGGMDTISDKEERLALVKKYARGDNVVIYEGLITGKTYGAMGALSDSRGQKGNWIYTFMDTPFEKCVQRVLKRRKAAGNDAPFDPERTMRSTFKACQSVAKRAGEAGHRVVMLNHKEKPEVLAAELLGLIYAHA